MAAVVHEQLKALIELQTYDSEIHRLRKELGEQPAAKKRLEAEFEKKRSSFKAADDQLKSRQTAQKQKELDLGTAEEKIRKLQSQLYTLKTNKEYQAMELEIKGLKADKSLLEEDILRLLDAVDDAKKAVQVEKDALAVEEKKHKAELDVIAKREAEITARLAELEGKRQAYLPSVEKRLLGQYERILKGRDGLALVAVRSGACEGCHMELPPQTVNEIQIEDKIIICESCARILYWPQ